MSGLPYKLRLNVNFNGKKMLIALTDPNATIQNLKEIIKTKFALPDLTSFSLETDQGFLLDGDTDALANTLLDDKDIIEVKSSTIQPPAQITPALVQPFPAQTVPVISPLNPPPATASVSMPAQAPPPVPILPPKEEAKFVDWPLRTEESFKFRFFEKENGFSKVFQFGLPTESETLLEYMKKVIKFVNLPVESTQAFLYHESGAPMSTDIAQQQLIKCSEVIIKDQYYYVITVPISLDPFQPYVLLDSKTGKDEVKYDLKGRVFTAKVDLGVTTYAQFKQKIAMTAKASPKRLRVFIDINEQLDENVMKKEDIGSNTLTVELNTGRMKAFIENFDLAEMVTGQTIQGLREFKSCLYVIAKRYKNETSNLLQGVLRYLSKNNAPMMAAFKRLREKKILTLSEKVAIEKGFYHTFRSILENTNMIKDPSVKAQKIVSNVFEYSRAIFMSIFEFISKVAPSTTILSFIEATETYKESDFVCPFSMKQIENPVEVRLDNNVNRICEKSSIEKIIKEGKEVPGIKDPLKIAAVTSAPLLIMKTVFYCLEAPTLTYWTANTRYNLADIKQHLSPYDMPAEEEKLVKSAESNEYLRIYNSLTIKYYGNFPCMIQDTNNLYGVAEQIMDCGTTNVYYDVSKGDTITIKTVATEVAVKQAEEIKDEIIITEPPEEVIVLLFDTSGSMQEEYVEKIEKLRAAKSFFFTFADRALGYNLKSAISLILFSHSITVKCQFTERFRSFKRHVESVSPAGSTRMYDAILTACENLNKFGSEYPAALKRIIVFSDGEDTGSHSTAFSAAQTCRNSKVLVDSVVVGTRNQELKGISLSTGGCSYFFTGLEEGVQMFENETFLKAALRKKSAPLTMNTDADLQSIMHKAYSNGAPEMIINPLSQAKVLDPTAAVAKVVAHPTAAVNVHNAAPSGGAGMKRLVNEITALTQNPLPNFYFFPSESDPKYWKIIMIGPSGSPYEGYTYILSMQFPAEYPFKAPEVRFITPIYHCNVSKMGKICHSVLSHNYSPAITVKEILIHINNLMIEPNIDDQIENSVAQDYYVDKKLYYAKLEESCKKNANLTLEQRLLEMGITIATITLHHPQDYLDPLTKQLMIEPMISPSSSYSFDKAVIIEQIKTKGVDPISNKPLKEEELKANEDLKKVIDKYRASIFGKK